MKALTRLLLILLLLPLPAAAWWNCDWDYRFSIGISGSGGSLSDYQVRLDLNSGNVPATFDWNLQGDDLRLVDQDDLTELDFFIEQWDSISQTAVVWVRLTTLPAAGRSIYAYYGAPAGTSSSSTVLTFTEPGLKFHTRRSTANPSNRAAAEAAFDAAPDGVNGYGCKFVSDYVNISNRSEFGPPNRSNDIGLFAEAFFEVGAGQTGVWNFRYGADFGSGGGLYVDDVALDEKWNDDLWWAYNWNNTGEILQGSINLSAGNHSIRILGFEGCCDGGLTVQFQRPGGPWLDMSLANISMASRKCPIFEPAISYGAEESSTCPDMSIVRSIDTYSDPFNGTTNAMSIPGAVMLNTVTLGNAGTGPVDADSVIITEAIPANVDLRVADYDGATVGPVEFVEGSPASGMTFVFISLGSTTDDVEFSSDGGASYGYTPTANVNGADPSVTHIRIRPSGTFQGDSGAGAPNAMFNFKTIVE